MKNFWGLDIFGFYYDLAQHFPEFHRHFPAILLFVFSIIVVSNRDYEVILRGFKFQCGRVYFGHNCNEYSDSGGFTDWPHLH